MFFISLFDTVYVCGPRKLLLTGLWGVWSGQGTERKGLTLRAILTCIAFVLSLP